MEGQGHIIEHYYSGQPGVGFIDPGVLGKA